MVSLHGVVNYDAAHSQRLFNTGGPLMVRCGTGGLVGARNWAARHFLDKATEEWLWMVDTDMGFLPDTVERLVVSADPVERPVVGALTFGLRMSMEGDGFGGFLTEPFPVLYGWSTEGDLAGNPYGFRQVADYPRNQIVQVMATGAACLLIHRTALEKVRAQYGDAWFEPVKYPDGRMVSEDLSFCYRLSRVGVPLHVDTGIKTTHAKTVWVGEEDWLRHRLLSHALQQASGSLPSTPPDGDYDGGT